MLDELSLPQLEQRLSDLDSELEQLANYSLRGGTGAPGYRSNKYRSPNKTESLRIELGKTATIDQVVLVPVLWRDSETGVRGEGFPLEYSIEAGTDHTSQVVASFSTEDQLMPRIAPQAVSFPAVEASWVRIEVTMMSPDIGDEFYSLQLAEVFVFDGMENVALQRPVTTTTRQSAIIPDSERFLTDGFTPYLMDAAVGTRSQTQMIRVAGKPRTPPTLTLDLQASYPVNQINLHTANVALSIPMLHFSSWAIPSHLRVTGANHPDFSDESILFEHEQETIHDAGPIIMERFPEARCRYIRITILDHHPVVSPGTDSPHIAFTEIEVLSNGRNVAVDAPISSSSNLTSARGTLERMSDGLNYYGQILPTRVWMNQLARRHDLEVERPLVVAELNLRYERQKKNLHILAWAVAVLSMGTLVTILIGKVLRQRAILQTRERIAANLHDELGANLHAIGLFGDLAKQEASKAGGDDKWSQLIRYLEEVRTLTEEAGRTARYTTNMLEAKELYENLTEEMRRTAARLLTDLDHEISFSNEEMLQALQPRRRVGLFLFYKECLTNIIRHSGATRVETSLAAKEREICLTVRDNGRGLEEASHAMAPASLKRRARLLKAKLSVETPPDGGTQITLKLKPRRGFMAGKSSKAPGQGQKS